MRMAYGHVVPQDITWMKQEMDKVGKDKPVILVTHYPMQDGDVDNWYDVTDAVRPYNIRTFIGGHYHRNRFLSYDVYQVFLPAQTYVTKTVQAAIAFLISLRTLSLLTSNA